jgi:hypothetical protein
MRPKPTTLREAHRAVLIVLNLWNLVSSSPPAVLQKRHGGENAGSGVKRL